MVLDISDYILFHPGGKFVLEKNIGRDITKFYSGSYSMQNGSADKVKLHTYSNQADK